MRGCGETSKEAIKVVKAKDDDNQNQSCKLDKEIQIQIQYELQRYFRGKIHCIWMLSISAIHFCSEHAIILQAQDKVVK